MSRECVSSRGEGQSGGCCITSESILAIAWASGTGDAWKWVSFYCATFPESLASNGTCLFEVQTYWPTSFKPTFKSTPASQKPLSTSNVGKECHESRRWQCQNHGSGHHSQISPNKSLFLDARSIIFKSGDFTTSPNMEFINNRAALCRHSDKAFIWSASRLESSEIA